MNANKLLSRLAENVEQAEKREREALAVYRPMPTQEPWHRSFASEKILRGGKRAGKTLAVAAEFAAVVTERPIIGMDGKEISIRRPDKHRKKDKLAWIIGWDQKHIGQTIHRVLFDSGLLQIIRDEQTGEWRAYNENLPNDVARKSEVMASEPLIPERFLLEKGAWAWEAKSSDVFSTVKLETGWEICAFPSTQPQAKQGDPVDLIWLDEDIRFSRHYKEWQDRLSTRRGRIIWSVWPHSNNDALVEVSERAAAEAEANVEPRSAFETVIRFSDNPYVETEEKKLTWARMGNDDERRVRDFGEFLFDRVRVYDYSPAVHSIPSGREDCPIDKIWNEQGRFPREWTRFLSVDPSHTRSGIVFGVIPPPQDYGNVLIIEDELLLERYGCDALAKAVKEKLVGKGPYEWFVMDNQIGRRCEVGQTVSNMRQFADSFAKFGVKSRLSGNSFLAGSNEILARQNQVRSLLYDDGLCKTTGLRVVAERCPRLIWEIKNVSRRMVADEVTEKIAGRKHDLVDALEYLVAQAPEYVEPSVYVRQGGPVYQFVQDFNKQNNREKQDFVHFGPGSGSPVAA